MKKKYFLLISLITILSCNKNEPVNYAIISGKIINAGDKITLYNQYNNTYDGKSKTIYLAKNGLFRDTIYISTGKLYRFHESRNLTEFIINNGDEIVVNYDAENHQNTLFFTGEKANENNYFAKKNRETSKIKKGNRVHYSKEEAEYKKELSLIKKKQEKLLNNTQGISKDFKRKEKNNIYYEYLLGLKRYKLYHALYANKRGFKPSDNFTNTLKNELSALTYDNVESFKYSSYYRDLVDYFYSEKGIDFSKKKSLQIDLSVLTIFSRIQNETIKNYLLYKYAVIRIKRSKNVDDFYRLFSKSSTDLKNNKAIRNIYTELKKLSKGDLSPKFINYKNNNEGVVSLDDFNGKYIYIDIWATWCKPCIKEIPYLNSLEKKYNNKNIQFVGISIDNKSALKKWKKMIVDKKMSGIQLIADNMKQSSFMKEYQVNAIPRYILIDPEGKIVTANAPRPSNIKLTELFNELGL